MITHFLAPTETWEPRRFARLFFEVAATQMPSKMAGVNFGSCKVYEMQIITLYEVIQTWNSKQPVLCCCFSWMIPNLYIGNCCLTKHPFKHGCSEFQLYTHTHIGMLPHPITVAKVPGSLRDPLLKHPVIVVRSREGPTSNTTVDGSNLLFSCSEFWKCVTFSPIHFFVWS